MIEHFNGRSVAEVALIVASKPTAGVIDHAANHNVEHLVIDKVEYQSGGFLNELTGRNIDFIVLAGFLWKIPAYLLKAFPNRVVNIHPSLLPKYGGKGMYGINVHQSVIDSGDQQSGITIHFVNENYDEGAPAFQATCQVLPEDDASTLAARVLDLEHEHFPVVVEQILSDQHAV